MDIPLRARACARAREIIEEFRTVKIGSGIRHPLGRFCTPKRSKKCPSDEDKIEARENRFSTTISGSVRPENIHPGVSRAQHPPRDRSFRH
jgi:hypothetical protein